MRWWGRKKKVEEMAKKNDWTVRYKTIGDGLAPTLTPFGAVLRIPLGVQPRHDMDPTSEYQVRLGVSFSEPVLVSPVPGLLVEVDGGPIVHADQQVTLRVGKNAHIDAKQVVATVFFFRAPDELSSE